LGYYTIAVDFPASLLWQDLCLSKSVTNFKSQTINKKGAKLSRQTSGDS